ncbi:putative type VI secretion system effector [Paraburkholderia sp. SUR17]|uniref:putative type VI secretion system effector n=1 Tax=Paraburkholderia sp. SUR17 TaxID=3034358 RepID=UPI002407C31F|nr:putative type VI secretion system effector [Paraburkholderia sp. SUR17]WEY37709.1 putative type VI secretion system effector [Paraburkholderia sp. SUR17]
MKTTDMSSTQLLRGRVQNLRKTRCSQDFFFTPEDRAKMGGTAIAAGLAGLGGIATGLSGMAMDTTEEADLLEFELDGKQVRAWVWVSVFEDGDEVEVVAERWGDVWQGYGIRRLTDRIVALHPHCSRGRYAHYKAFAKWWLIAGGALVLTGCVITVLMALVKSIDDWKGIFVMCALGGLGSMAIFGLIAYRVAGKMTGFVRLAEGIFQGFGWKNVKSIDLPALTKKNKRPEDPGALGVLYFRY